MRIPLSDGVEAAGPTPLIDVSRSSRRAHRRIQRTRTEGGPIARHCPLFNDRNACPREPRPYYNDEGTYVTNQQLGSSTTLFAEVARPRISPAPPKPTKISSLRPMV